MTLLLCLNKNGNNGDCDDIIPVVECLNVNFTSESTMKCIKQCITSKNNEKFVYINGTWNGYVYDGKMVASTYVHSRD